MNSRMASETARGKAQLRRAMRDEIERLTSEERARASRLLCARLQDQPVWRHAGTILFYAPLADEPDISPLLERVLEEGRMVLLPRYNAGRGSYEACRVETPLGGLPVGRFGIREPVPASRVVPLKQLDLVLVPGLAFDWSGHRLGRGRGCYDRLLREVAGTKCGVAFETQLQAEVPVEPHDVWLEYIVTSARWLDCRRRD